MSLSIVIVGSSKSIFSKEFGAAIEGHDLVIRVNCVREDQAPEFFGKRTDIWSRNLNDLWGQEGFLESNSFFRTPVKEVWICEPFLNLFWVHFKATARKDRVLRNYFRRTLRYYNLRIQYKVTQKMTSKQWKEVGGLTSASMPTSGLVTIYFARKRYPNAKLSIVGFGNRDTVSERVDRWHNFKEENHLLKRYRKQGILEMIDWV